MDGDEQARILMDSEGIDFSNYLPISKMFVTFNHKNYLCIGDSHQELNDYRLNLGPELVGNLLYLLINFFQYCFDLFYFDTLRMQN